MYGAAAYHRWRDGHDTPKFMKDYHAVHYEHIPLPPRSMSSSSDGSRDDSDDARDGDHEPRAPPTQRSHAHRHHEKYSAVIESMDSMNAYLMILSGYRPGEKYAQQQRQEEEASRKKVEDWLQAG